MDDFGKVILLLVVIGLVFGILPLITMLLWNALVPTIFGIGIINFWQALGLIILSHCLFPGKGSSKS